MKTRHLFAVEAALLLFGATVTQAAAPTTLFVAKSGPDMKVRLEGTSTVHDWQVEGHILGGQLEVGPNFPTEPGQTVTPGKVEAKATVRIPVTSLKSIEKDRHPYN